jgi:hypothetical protein
MDKDLAFLLIVSAWIALQWFVLPRFGVST